jgi:hypothetical protein
VERSEAAAVIRGIADSIRQNPAQFHINVTVVGQQVTSHGGTGLSIHAVGGGPGSTTIGQTVSLQGAQVKISQQHATQALEQQFQALLTSLDTMASHLEAQAPDKGVLSNLYHSLLNTWVPGVITSVLGTVLSKAIGM